MGAPKGKAAAAKTAGRDNTALTNEEKQHVLSDGGSSSNYMDAINKSKLLNSMTKSDLKSFAKSKDDKARQFVLSAEHFEKQQAAKAAKAERDILRAEKERKKFEREEKMKSLGTKGRVEAAPQSIFTELAAEMEESGSPSKEEKGKSKKQLRRGGKKKGATDSGSDEDGADEDEAGVGLFMHFFALSCAVAVVAVVFREHPAMLPVKTLIDELAQAEEMCCVTDAVVKFLMVPVCKLRESGYIAGGPC